MSRPKKKPNYNSDNLMQQLLAEVSEDLYKKSCPLCGWEDVEILLPEEQFDIVGCKGNIYKMRYHCMREKCGYYW